MGQKLADKSANKWAKNWPTNGPIFGQQMGRFLVRYSNHSKKLVPKNFEIFGLWFWTLIVFGQGFRTIFFRKIFGFFLGKFQCSKPLFSFGPVLTYKIQGMSKQRESQMAKNFRPTLCLTLDSLLLMSLTL